MQGGYILLISGPSGAGKSTLLTRLMSEFKDELYFSISCTTRKPRDGEIDGVHYHFISEESFQKGIDEGAFLEWAKVHNNFYGTSLKHTQKALSEGRVVIFDIDVQGFCIVKEKLKDELSSVFITTKTKNELEKRLINRKTDTIDTIKKRLIVAENEMNFIAQYDFLIINEDLEQSYKELKAIFDACKKRVQNKNIAEIQTQWYKGE
ncbi:guanylate kinase [Campylobacter sp. MIT 12-5580]|uniref:guanylate kinase n=1 Tax=Campylobacter sp. MIT 12-5580 TaxID=2040651 RepID=UPI0010F7113D|nr:guanylate kinase [Campylobacter sp. MIT 12-5580]TKX30127.1 guanylate kinase [Campylobacter sp. MIT 12-5580]